MTGFRLLFLSWVLLVLLPTNGLAQQGREQVEQIEKLRDKANAEKRELEQQAKQIREEILSLQKKLIAVGARISSQNQRSVEAEERLLSLQKREASSKEELLADQAAMTEILAALQRTEMSPPPPLAVSPDDVLAAARASILMGATIPELQVRADALKASLSALQTVRQQIARGRMELQKEMQSLAGEQQSLQELLQQRRSLEISVQADAKAAAETARTLAENANDLRELIHQLEIETSKAIPSIKPKTPPKSVVLAPRLKPGKQEPLLLLPYSSSGRFSDNRGKLELPVHAKVTKKYGRSQNPDTINGLVFRTARRAQIVAPYDGRIAYAGPFRNFGNLLILDVGEGYHMILAGISVPYVVLGQMVLAGEPLGKMADRRKPAPEFYLEFRKNGQPFDPEPWLKKDINAG